MEKVKIGKVEEVDFIDLIIGKKFKVEICDIYTVISIGDRYFYFNKDGKFDGTSTDCRPPIED